MIGALGTHRTSNWGTICCSWAARHIGTAPSGTNTRLTHAMSMIFHHTTTHFFHTTNTFVASYHQKLAVWTFHVAVTSHSTLFYRVQCVFCLAYWDTAPNCWNGKNRQNLNFFVKFSAHDFGPRQSTLFRQWQTCRWMKQKLIVEVTHLLKQNYLLQSWHTHCQRSATCWSLVSYLSATSGCLQPPIGHLSATFSHWSVVAFERNKLSKRA